MAIDLGDFLKLAGLLLVFAAAVFAANKETVAGTEAAQRARRIAYGFAAAGLLIGAGTQLFEAYKSHLSSEEQRKRHEQVTLRLERVAASLDSTNLDSTTVHRISIVCFFDSEVTEATLREPGAFRLVTSFQIGNRLALNVKANPNVPGTSSAGEVVMDAGGFARIPLLAEDLAISERPILDNSGTSFWVYLWPGQIVDRAYRARVMQSRSAGHSDLPYYVDWPFRRVGDFVGNPIGFGADGPLAKNLRKIVLRINDDISAEFPVSDGRVYARDTYSVLKRVSVRQW